MPERIDKSTAQALAGDKFDERQFDTAAIDGTVSREAFASAAEEAALAEQAALSMDVSAPAWKLRQLQQLRVDLAQAAVKATEEAGNLVLELLMETSVDLGIPRPQLPFVWSKCARPLDFVT